MSHFYVVYNSFKLRKPTEMHLETVAKFLDHSLYINNMYILYIYIHTLKFEIGKSTQSVGLGMGAVAHSVKPPLECPHLLSACPGILSQLYSDSASCGYIPWEARDDGLSMWVSIVYMGDPWSSQLLVQAWLRTCRHLGSLQADGRSL